MADARTPTPAEPEVQVLIVDDAPELETSLEGLGLHLAWATTAEEAFRLTLERDFGVVLVAVRLGGMDGFDLARQVRGRERSRHMPIIFLARAGDSASVEEAYALGAVDYLVKPVPPVILRAKVG